VIQEIIDGIVAALRTAFPEVTRIYTEQVKQGLKEPCFILQLVNPTSEQFLGNRHYRTNLFSVQYIPQSKTNVKAECYDVNDRLFQALEYITVGGDLQRGTDMRGEYFNGVLTFFVNFNMFVQFNPELDPMEELSVENQAK
jgi:hypothetical protein